MSVKESNMNDLYFKILELIQLAKENNHAIVGHENIIMDMICIVLNLKHPVDIQIVKEMIEIYK